MLRLLTIVLAVLLCVAVMVRAFADDAAPPPGGTTGHKPKVQISLLYVQLMPGVPFLPPHADATSPGASGPAPGSQAPWESYLQGLYLPVRPS